MKTKTDTTSARNQIQHENGSEMMSRIIDFFFKSKHEIPCVAPTKNEKVLQLTAGESGYETYRSGYVAPTKNKSVLQGCWGEQVAVNYLNRKGLTVVAQRVRPCAKDLRCEIDLIVKSKDRKSLVFVEVKTHKERSRFAGRLWAVNRRKKFNLLRACSNWLMHNHWHGNFRFDVIEVYGSFDSNKPPEIDHIENVPLFPAKWRFW